MTFMLGSESSTVLSLPGAKVPPRFRSQERKFQGAKVPGNESSTYGTFVPGSESTRERKFHNSLHLAVGLSLWQAWWSGTHYWPSFVVCMSVLVTFEFRCMLKMILFARY